jgi:5-methylcytosine-specific restriction endonuclease McrA
MTTFNPITTQVRAAVIARDGMICQLCGCDVVSGSELYRSAWTRVPGTNYLSVPPRGHFKNMLTLDHIVPRSKDGTHDVDNLRVTCMSCNSTRGPGHVRLEPFTLEKAREYITLEADGHALLLPFCAERDGIRVGVAILGVDGKAGILRAKVTDPDAVARILSAARQLLPLLGYRGVVITTQLQGDAR